MLTATPTENSVELFSVSENSLAGSYWRGTPGRPKFTKSEHPGAAALDRWWYGDIATPNQVVLARSRAAWRNFLANDTVRPANHVTVPEMAKTGDRSPKSRNDSRMFVKCQKSTVAANPMVTTSITARTVKSETPTMNPTTGFLETGVSSVEFLRSRDKPTQNQNAADANARPSWSKGGARGSLTTPPSRNAGPFTRAANVQAGAY